MTYTMEELAEYERMLMRKEKEIIESDKHTEKLKQDYRDLESVVRQKYKQLA
jgi:hypothetical protein